MALVSLPDSTAAGAGVGLSVLQAPLLEDLASVAAATPDGALVITDAAAVPGLAGHPLVSGAPCVRFYASVCVTDANGEAAGWLAVLDPSPRVLTPAQAASLHALARQAARLVALAAHAERAQTLAQSLSLECERLTQEAQRRRKEDGELLELVLRGGDLGLWDLDVPSGHWSVNAREYAMLGYPDDAKPATLDWKSLVHPEDWSVIWTAFKEHLHGASVFCEAEHRLRHRDGHWIWVLNRCVAVERDASGRPVRVVGTHMDVTARKLEEDARRRAGERLALALSGGDIGLWDLDVATGRATYNEQWWRMFGYAADELETVDGLWQSMVHPDDYAEARAGLARHVAGESAMYEGEVRVRHKDGRWLWIQNRAKVVERGLDGSALRIVGVNLNITESKQNVLALEVEQRRLRLITDNIPALITELDLDERVIFCNGRYQSWLGIEPDAVLNQPIRDTLGDTLYELRKPELARAFAGETVSFEETAQLLVGKRTLQTTYLPHKNEEGAVVGLYCLANDISELKQKQMLLDALAREDALTGLPNRRSFEERVCDAMARSRRSRTLICLMYLDVDNFKHINDSHGHAGGDAVLKEFARRIKRGVRTTDMAARYAGDEFVLLLEDVAGEEAAAIAARRILAALKPVFGIPGGALRVTT
ncbi:MAG: PAS domain-containing protein, partial [Burkholderiaceae bacterium]